MKTVLDKVNLYLATNFNFINPECCDIDNANVFDVCLRDDSDYAIIISPGWSDEERDQRHGFDAQLFNWEVLVNFHRVLYGTKEEQAESIKDAYEKVEIIHRAIVHDVTLNNTVTSAHVTTIAPPMSYSRTERDDWILIPISLRVKEIL